MTNVMMRIFVASRLRGFAASYGVERAKLRLRPTVRPSVRHPSPTIELYKYKYEYKYRYCMAKYYYLYLLELYCTCTE